MDNLSISINERVQIVKSNSDEINRLIEEYKPFIASVVQGFTGKYVNYGEDDELSIGLMAFEEAIKSYDSSKGNFLVFARNVIKRRLIDYYRKEQKHNRVVPLISSYSLAGDEEEEFDLSTQESIKEYAEGQISELRRLEIEELRNELAQWGISFFDVAKSSPKQGGTREIYSRVINFILNNPQIVEVMKKKKYLPVAEIEKSVKIPRKKIERGRNYIIAVVLILSGDYQYIKDFIKWR